MIISTKNKNTIQLEYKDILSDHKVPAKITEVKQRLMIAPDQRLTNIIEIQDPKNMLHNQSTINNLLVTALEHKKSTSIIKITERKIPRITENKTKSIGITKHNLINLR